MSRASAIMKILLLFLLSCSTQSGSPTITQPKSVTGIWQGSLDLGASIVLNIIEIRSDSIAGELSLASSNSIDTFKIVTGRRKGTDSLEFQAQSGIGFLTLRGVVVDSIMFGDYFLFIFSPPDEGSWNARRIN